MRYQPKLATICGCKFDDKCELAQEPKAQDASQTLSAPLQRYDTPKSSDAISEEVFMCVSTTSDATINLTIHMRRWHASVI